MSDLKIATWLIFGVVLCMTSLFIGHIYQHDSEYNAAIYGAAYGTLKCDVTELERMRYQIETLKGYHED